MAKKKALLNDSTPFREQNLKRNIYSKTNEYSISHPNAMSDGDTKGRGEKNGQVGTSVDIAMRNRLLAKNKYSKDTPYDSVDETPIS